MNTSNTQKVKNLNRLQNLKVLQKEIEKKVFIQTNHKTDLEYIIKEKIEEYDNLKKDYIDKGLVKFEHHAFPLDLAALNAEVVIRCQSNNDTKFKTVVFRPSIVFGERDSFFNRFNRLLKYIPIFPLACPKSLFSPIYVKDLSNFVVESALTSQYDNQINNVTGPKNYTFLELIKFKFIFQFETINVFCAIYMLYNFFNIF